MAVLRATCLPARTHRHLHCGTCLLAILMPWGCPVLPVRPVPPEDKIRRVWTAIALHTAPGIPQFMEPDVALVTAGVECDVVRAGKSLPRNKALCLPFLWYRIIGGVRGNGGGQVVGAIAASGRTATAASDGHGAEIGQSPDCPALIGREVIRSPSRAAGHREGHCS